MNKYKALNTLAEIRDFMREKIGPIPQEICDDFNDLAKHLGTTVPDWCVPESVSPKGPYKDPYVEKQY